MFFFLLPIIDCVAVSGGSIFAALYGLAVTKAGGADRLDFSEFERDVMRKTLKGARDDLMAMRLVTTSSHKGQMLIQNRYDERFFGGAKLRDLPLTPRMFFIIFSAAQPIRPAVF